MGRPEKRKMTFHWCDRLKSQARSIYLNYNYIYDLYLLQKCLNGIAFIVNKMEGTKL